MFHKRLKQARIEAGLQHKEVAEKAGLTRPAYSNYEQGFRRPSYEKLVDLANVLDVTVDYLLGRTKYPNMRIVTNTELAEFLPEEITNKLRIEIDGEKLTDKQKERIINELRRQGML